MKTANMKTRCGGPSRAFTLVEILVVILVLGILLALGVGGAAALLGKADREKTIATQKVIMEAIAAFTDEMGELPTLKTSGAGKIDEKDLAAALLETLWGNNESPNLLDYNAWGSPHARELLQGFGEDVIKLNDGGDRSFFDVYGTEMVYLPTGGMGGTPRLVSGGPDGKVGENEDDDETKDDIFSDEN